MAGKTRIGAVSYLNTRPLVRGMEQGLGRERIELSYAVPSVLADRMTDGRLEIALLPIVELARIPDLELVPGLGIVTQGPSRSVLLVSRRPIDEIERVALDPESRTSNVLARVLFAEVWRRSPDFEIGPAELACALEDHDAAVRIGDKALFEPAPDGAFVYDLGGAWTEKTRLPFVFAAWAARPGVVDREIYRILHDSRRQGSKSIDAIVDGYDWKGIRNPEVAREYLTRHIRFRLGSPELEAIELFLEAARGLELIERVPKIKLALEKWTTCHEAAAARGMIDRPVGGDAA